MKNEQKQSSKTVNKGFTLIELLVVVLIIGILAAIALPQYRKAVAKAELSQIIMITKSLKQAQIRYYLIHNQYSRNLDNLDIEIDSNVTCTTGPTNEYNYIYCYNKNFALWSYTNLHTECGARTTNENSPLGYACKSLFNVTKCYVENSGICDALGNPCLRCNVIKNAF